MRTGAAALACAAALALPALAPRLREASPCAAPSAGDGAAQVRCAPGPALRGPARLLFGLRLDANRAEPASLEALPGIGPVRAAAIAAERCRHAFASTADLERVRGIGPRTRAGLEPWLAVEPGRPARCAPLH
jgi:predicted flap endonuclease-1-like 5' DNA nuclease